MFQFDDKFLQDLGLGSLPEDQKQAFLQHMYEELELRVGTRLSEGMTDQQLSEFEKLIDANDQPGALKWLETHRPNYKDVVAQELETLRQEVITNRDAILGQSQSLSQGQAQGPASTQPQYPTQPIPPPGQNDDPTELQIR